MAVTAGANRPEEPNDGMRAIAQRLEDRLPPSGVIRVDARSSKASRLLALDFQAGTVYALRRRGREVSTPLYASALGNRYKRPGPAAAAVHIYVDHPTPPQAQADERFKVPWVNGPVWVSVVIDPEGR